MCVADPVRVGLVGLGHNGRAHLASHLRLGQSEVVAVCDRNPALLAEVADAHPGAERYTDTAAMCASGLVEAVSIHTGDPHHVEPFVAALAAGRHVFCEKPLGNSLAQVATMVDAWRQFGRNRVVAVGYILRFNPVYEAVAAACHAGRLGRVYYQEADYIHNLLYQANQTDPHTGRNWYLEEEQPVCGGGSHALDLLRWFSGREVVEVSGYANHVAFPAMTADDCQVALFRFDDGGIAKVASLYGPRRAVPGFNNLRVYGTAGTVERDQIAVAAGPDDHHPEFAPVTAARVAGHPYDPEISDWLTCIRHGGSPRCGLLDGANSTAATLQAVAAIAAGGPLPVPVHRA